MFNFSIFIVYTRILSHFRLGRWISNAFSFDFSLLFSANFYFRLSLVFCFLFDGVFLLRGGQHLKLTSNVTMCAFAVGLINKTTKTISTNTQQLLRRNVKITFLIRFLLNSTFAFLIYTPENRKKIIYFVLFEIAVIFETSHSINQFKRRIQYKFSLMVIRCQ